MSDLITVPADAISGLLGVGAVCCERTYDDKPGALAVVFAQVGDEWRYVVPYMSTVDNDGRCYTVPACDLFLILFDPNDPDVSAAGMARAERALSAIDWDTHGAFYGDERAVAAERLRDAILTTGARIAGLAAGAG